MVLAAGSTGYPLLDVMLTIFVFFAWVLWFWLLITIFSDLFRRDDISGWGKAAWTIVVILIPLFGVLIYLIVQGHGMQTRNVKAAESAQKDFDQYVRSVSTNGTDPATQIQQAKALLDAGTISPQEFETLKAKALAG